MRLGSAGGLVGGALRVLPRRAAVLQPQHLAVKALGEHDALLASGNEREGHGAGACVANESVGGDCFLPRTSSAWREEATSEPGILYRFAKRALELQVHCYEVVAFGVSRTSVEMLSRKDMTQGALGRNRKWDQGTSLAGRRQ